MLQMRICMLDICSNNNKKRTVISAVYINVNVTATLHSHKFPFRFSFRRLIA